jgi:hypothetical protein
MRGPTLFDNFKDAAANTPLIGTLFSGPGAGLAGTETASTTNATSTDTNSTDNNGQRTHKIHDSLDNDSMSESTATLVATTDHSLSSGGLYKEMQLVVQPDAFILCAKSNKAPLDDDKSDMVQWDTVKISFTDTKFSQSGSSYLPSRYKQLC